MTMPFLRRLAGSSGKAGAERLYVALAEQARSPAFYAALAVPDTVDGRFEMIALHAFLTLRRLKAEPAGRPLAQAVFDAMFADMDRNLREMGVGDLSVGRKVKAMAEALYGRIAAYEAGLATDDDGLGAALRRNLYGTLGEPAAPGLDALAAMCGYVRAADAALARQSLDDVVRAGPLFPPPPRPRVPLTADQEGPM